MKKVVILVNKDFEYKGFREGIKSVLPNTEFPPSIVWNDDDIDSRRPIFEPSLARFVFENLEVDVYCIQYLFGVNENSSNSEIKYDNLTKLFSTFKTKPDYVMSFSTSESTPYSQTKFGHGSANGCVLIGNQLFLSDQSKCDPNTDSHLKITTSFYPDPPLHKDLYGLINDMKPEFLNFKQPPNSPSPVLKCYSDAVFVGIDVVNVMNYDCYEATDSEAYNQFMHFFPQDKMDLHIPVGIETTHGVVKMAMANTLSYKIPVMFISPITDRYLKFKEDVDKEGKQNFACSYNGGVATGHILTMLNELIGTEE